MGVQDLTLSMVLIVAVGVFLASFMDAIAGGGGFRFGVRENAGGDLFNSVHRFALFYGVTC